MAKRKLGEVHQCGCDVCASRPLSKEARKHRKINRMVSTLDEKNARRVIGMMAEQFGRGGVTMLHIITGLSRNTIMRGQRELAEHKDAVPPDRVRMPGGGRPTLEKKRQR